MNKPVKELLDRFYSHPDKMFSFDFNLWGITTFMNASIVIEHLMNNEPNSPYIKTISNRMVDYMKYCYDTETHFPWTETFPSNSIQDSKKQFIQFYEKNRK